MRYLQPIEQLLSLLIDNFGAGWTVLLLALAIGSLAGRRIYLDNRARKWFQVALDEKERTIQRLAEQEREWRLYFVMRDMGISRREADKLIQRNEFATPQQARESLERNKRRAGKASAKGRKR